jgi:hypothetical protein
MITVLNLNPITKTLCLAAGAVVWTFLFWVAYKAHTRRSAVTRAFWWHRYTRAYRASLAAKRRSAGPAPARQWDQLEAAFSTKDEAQQGF